MRSNRYKVAIHCQTFNHARFIEDMLKGIVMQETDFPFIAVVIDDCSTDGNVEIIRRYEAEYPDIIKGIYLTENHYSQQKSIWPYWEPYAESCEYIAICEGDDYWTDPLKLQKQVDLMDKHPECTLCITNADVVADGATEKFPFDFGELEEKAYSANELIYDWKAATASFLFRSRVLKTEQFAKIKYNKKLIISDIVLVMLCNAHGSILALPDKTCSYRQHGGGFTRQMRTPKYEYKFAIFWNECRRIFPEFSEALLYKEIEYHFSGIVSFLFRKEFSIKYFCISVLHCLGHPKQTLKRALKLK